MKHAAARASLVMLLVATVAPALAQGTEEEDMGRRVQRLLRAHADDVFGCVRGEKTDPKGELLLRMFVGEAGHVDKLDVLKESGTTPALRGCLLAKVQGWSVVELGAAPGDQVVFPLVFAPGGPRAAVSSWSASTSHRTNCSHPRPVPEGEYAVVQMAGRGEVRHAARTGSSVRLGPGDVFWTTGSASLELCAEGARGTSARFLLVAAVSKEVRPPMDRVVRSAEVVALPIAGGKGTVKLMLDGTKASFAVDLLTARAGVEIPPHRHAESDEWVAITAGRASTVLAGKTVSEPGWELHIPAGSEHSMKVEEAIEAVQVYSPRGPEQRFKQVPTKGAR